MKNSITTLVASGFVLSLALEGEASPAAPASEILCEAPVESCHPAHTHEGGLPVPPIAGTPVAPVASGTPPQSFGPGPWYLGQNGFLGYDTWV
jgi:hypothetical protein